MRFAYRFAGVAIHADRPIAGLRRDDDPATSPATRITLHCTVAPPPGPDSIVFSWPGRYATRLGKIDDDWLIDSRIDGVFRVDRAITTVDIYSERDPPSAAAVDVLVRRVLPRLLAARGAITLHAAAAATADGGLLLLGASGAGKSTMTAAIATTPGWDVFSDDLSILWEGAPPTVAPAATGVCLWEASRAGLGIDAAFCHAMSGYDGKYRFDSPAPPRTAPAPLRALVFLSRETGIDAPRIEPMNRAKALIHAAREVILFNPAAPPEAEPADAFARLNRITAGIETVRLRYPARFDALPDVAALLAGLLRA